MNYANQTIALADLNRYKETIDYVQSLIEAGIAGVPNHLASPFMRLTEDMGLDINGGALMQGADGNVIGRYFYL